MKVETTEKRINPVKKALVGTSLVIVLLAIVLLMDRVDTYFGAGRRVEINVSEKRSNSTKMALNGTCIDVIPLTDVVEDEQLVANIDVAGHKYNSREYKQLRDGIVRCAINRTKLLSNKDRDILFAVYNRENNKERYKLNTAGGVIEGIIEAMAFREANIK